METLAKGLRTGKGRSRATGEEAVGNNLGRRQWTLGPRRKSDERLGVTVPEFSEVERERRGRVRMIPEVSDLSTWKRLLQRRRRLPAMYQAVQRWREQKKVLAVHTRILGRGRITHDTYERRTGNSNYKRINQTDAECQNSTDEKGYGWSGRRSIVLAVALKLPF